MHAYFIKVGRYVLRSYPFYTTTSTGPLFYPHVWTDPEKFQQQKTPAIPKNPKPQNAGNLHF
jgi:hypothetical protein